VSEEEIDGVVMCGRRGEEVGKRRLRRDGAEK
jgi:hypothetical protein